MDAMTELEAVNEMLLSIGQAPVNSLDVAGIRDVAIAQTTLDNVSRSVQLQGWHFNTDYEYELTPNGSNNVLVPSNVLFIEPNDPSQDYVIRDNAGTLMLWDREDKTFTITVNPVKVDIVWGFDFIDIPQYARNYIALRAARRFQALVVGSQILHTFTQQDELDALAMLKRMDGRNANVNILNTGNFTDQIFQRRINPRTGF